MFKKVISPKPIFAVFYRKMDRNFVLKILKNLKNRLRNSTYIIHPYLQGMGEGTKWQRVVGAYWMLFVVGDKEERNFKLF